MVVFPEPLGPNSDTNLPRSTSHDMSLTATNFPNFLVSEQTLRTRFDWEISRVITVYPKRHTLYGVAASAIVTDAAAAPTR